MTHCGSTSDIAVLKYVFTLFSSYSPNPSMSQDFKSLNLSRFRYGGVNVTGFQLLDTPTLSRDHRDTPTSSSSRDHRLVHTWLEQLDQLKQSQGETVSQE